MDTKKNNPEQEKRHFEDVYADLARKDATSLLVKKFGDGFRFSPLPPTDDEINTSFKQIYFGFGPEENARYYKIYKQAFTERFMFGSEHSDQKIEIFRFKRPKMPAVN